MGTAVGTAVGAAVGTVVGAVVVLIVISGLLNRCGGASLSSRRQGFYMDAEGCAEGHARNAKLALIREGGADA